MDRRTLLAAFSSGLLSGCLDAGSRSSRPAKPTLRVRPRPLREELAELIYFRVEPERGFVDGPGRLRMTVGNRTDEPIELTFGGTPPFSSLVGRNPDTDATLQIVPDANRGMLETDVGGPSELFPLEGAECPRAQGHAEVREADRTTTLGPDETVSELYSLLSGADTDDCLPDGEYRFESSEPFDVTSASGQTVRSVGGKVGLQFSIHVRWVTSTAEE